jgi:hypothetical protein
LIGLVIVMASGCAKADWIDRTLVTVDVTGEWTGAGSGGEGDQQFALTLRQTGPKATGSVSLLGWGAHNWNGPVVGTINGDVFSFSRDDGRIRGEVLVAGDEMSGTVAFAPVTSSACCPAGMMSGTKALKLRRAP